MDAPLLHPVRVHGRRPLIVVVMVLVALVSLARPARAVGVPVEPVPVGVWPLQPAPQVLHAFDPPDSLWGAGHRGVDLAGAVGETVRTALGGRVAFASVLAGRGVVVVDHGSTRTTYEPVRATVRAGATVARGQPIGTLELAGSHCFPTACLHWGWRRGSTYLDPLLLVGGGPIILLPLGTGPVAPVSPGVTSPFEHVARQLTERSAPVPTQPRAWPHAIWRRPLAMRPLLF